MLHFKMKINYIGSKEKKTKVALFSIFAKLFMSNLIEDIWILMSASVSYLLCGCG